MAHVLGRVFQERSLQRRTNSPGEVAAISRYENWLSEAVVVSKVRYSCRPKVLFSVIVAAYYRVGADCGRGCRRPFSQSALMVLDVLRERMFLFLVLTRCRCAISTALLVKPVRMKVQLTLIV